MDNRVRNWVLWDKLEVRTKEQTRTLQEAGPRSKSEVRGEAQPGGMNKGIRLKSRLKNNQIYRDTLEFRNTLLLKQNPTRTGSPLTPLPV